MRLDRKGQAESSLRQSHRVEEKLELEKQVRLASDRF
jgi:hypothetical protein